MLDVISIGDSTVDTFIKIHRATVECDINTKECKICLQYGSKIPVEGIFHSVAGNACNVAVGCTMLGLKSAIYTHLGDDRSGQMIKEALADRGVLDNFVVLEKNKNSNLSVVISYLDERSVLVYHQPWDYKLPQLQTAKWVYFTSVSESFKKTNLVGDVCRYIDKSRAKLAFGPGTYQLKAGVLNYPKLLEKCELLIVNLEEAKQILEIDAKEEISPDEIISKLLFLGPKIVVVTNAANGSFASDGHKYLRCGIFPGPIVEKTGAGDAYSSAFLAALVYGYQLTEAMVWGTINASHVMGEAGAQIGLLNREDLERHRKVMPDLVVSSL